MNETTTLSPAYERALAEHDAAGAKFRQIRDDYRAGRATDDEFLAARQRFAAATAVYDAAFALEAAR